MTAPNVIFFFFCLPLFVFLFDNFIFASSNFFFYSSFRIQALANLNEDDLPDVALQMTQAAGSAANTTWVIAKRYFYLIAFLLLV
jgi:hypothetical protein